MAQAYFITGTDTGIGKTWVTVALMEYFKAQGKSVVGMKPVASGCDIVGGKLVNDDAVLLQKHSSIELAYDTINPYAYKQPISPHLAGKDNPADFNRIETAFTKLRNQADIVLVEGAGGWYSPLNASQHNGDLAKALGLPVLLVIGLRLGCISHAVLTAKAVAADGASFAGWLVNGLKPDDGYDKPVIDTLAGFLQIPCLGKLPYSPGQNFAQMAQAIDFPAF